MYGIGLPLLRAAPWFPGQMGVPGSDVPRGLRTAPTGIVLYVDDEHPNATATADGTDPENPLSTIAAAVASPFLTEGSVIVVANQATIAESVLVPITAPAHVAIVGAGDTRHQPTWTSALATTPCLTIRQIGWTVSGFTFTVPASSAAILLQDTVLGGLAYKNVIEDCIFDGFWSGKYGIELQGAPHRLTVRNCQFLELHQAGNDAFAIIVTSTPNASPYECEILNNLFWENDNHIGGLGAVRGFNVSVFAGNVFAVAGLIAAALKLDLRGGTLGRNIVYGNVFPGDYSNIGGYWDGAAGAGTWIGNLAEDTAEAEVGDNGFTILPPA